VRFSEHKLEQGTGVIPFPNLYEGKINSSEGTIYGTWSYNDQQGQFHLRLDHDNWQRFLEESKSEKSAHIDKAVVSANASISGFLTKQGKLRKTWKSRFFVLENGILSYYDNKEMYPGKPAGRIELKTVLNIQDRPDKDGKSHLFEVVAPQRTFFIQAESEEKRKEWLDILRLEHKNYKV